MKKITCTLILVLGAMLLGAQVPNGGFEIRDTLGNARHWTKMYIFPVWTDSDGVFHTDTIMLNPRFYQSSRVAHSGSWAMELLNGFNVTKNEGIAGAIDLTGTSDGYQGFSARLPLTSPPKELRFWYKFFPVAGDTAQALLTTYDSTGAESGHAEILLTAWAGNYTEAHVPVSYTTPETGATSFSLSFSASKTSSNAHFGTRLLIDDVNLPTLGIRPEPIQALRSYPTLVSDQVHVELPVLTQAADWQLLNTSGQVLRNGSVQTGSRLSLSVAELPAGHYMITLQADDGRYLTRFVKQ